VRIWRITRAAHTALDGEGARRYGGRWTPKGSAAVYGSATLSLAALERFVHSDPAFEPTDLVAIAVEIDANVSMHSVEVADLPPTWRQYPAPAALALVGGRWLQEAATAILSVPSVVIPHERNYVINPGHSDVRRLVAGPPEPFRFDPRMWTTRTSARHDPTRA
jgi:RES domain-containing protein